MSQRQPVSRFIAAQSHNQVTIFLSFGVKEEYILKLKPYMLHRPNSFSLIQVSRQMDNLNVDRLADY